MVLMLNQFTEVIHNIQSVGVTDKYDSANLTVNGADGY